MERLKRPLRLAAYITALAYGIYMIYVIVYVQVFGFFYILGPLIEGWVEVGILGFVMGLFILLIVDEVRDWYYRK